MRDVGIYRRWLIWSMLALVLPGFMGEARAQGVVDPDHGIVSVAGSLRGLGSVKRVLLIGAHPDDEDTGLLATLERGLGADAAYLSLNRGEGGQNLIGPELGVGLGLIRSEELLAARRVDGAEQFFTRAYDFGYSKSAAETFQMWPRDSLLADVVSIIRTFRPQVVVSIFSGTPRDGHGHHQAAGILAREAFEVAGDSAWFPDQIARGLDPWTPLKLYRSTRFDRDATTLAVETGALDPLYGRSYHQIAMASRSRHRSQDMGRIEGLGPHETRLQRLETRVDAPATDREMSLFAGIDTTLVGAAGGIDRSARGRELVALLGDYLEEIDRARERLAPGQPAHALPALARALGLLREASALAAEAGRGGGQLRFVLSEKESQLAEVLADAAGVVVDAFADDEMVVPGQSFTVEIQVWNGGPEAVRLEAVELPGAETPMPVNTHVLSPGAFWSREVRIQVPDDAAVDRPYFLERPLKNGVYAWPEVTDGEDRLRGRPFGPPRYRVRARLAIRGEPVELEREVVHRFADPARGEVRRPVRVVPAVNVQVSSRTAIWPLDRTAERMFTVRLHGEGPDGLRGTLRLQAPDGWTVTPGSTRFHLESEDAVTSASFRVTPPSGLERGSYPLRARAESRGRAYTEGFQVVDYEHIRPRLLYRDARIRLEALTLKVDRGRRVGYVPGAGDAVPDALREMGVDPEELDAASLASGDLSRYDVIVVGIRAYETNPAVVSNNRRLLDWVRGGGTLIVQYQQYGFFRGGFAPYPLSATYPHDRVTDETAPVRLLAPAHPIFNHPNEIGQGDFAGWVQERGLYFAHDWDSRYEPLLETGDADEEPKRGGLLVTSVGAGVYLYTGLALFRQLPAGVPGAYRLLANLLELGG